MYSFLLALHSLIRWLVLSSLLFAIYRAYRGWFAAKPFAKYDENARYFTTLILHTQFIIGIALYFISPVVYYFLHHFNVAVHERQIRFFGMEHVTMMFVAIVVISIGSAKTKRKPSDAEKFRTMAIWFTIGLLIIFIIHTLVVFTADQPA